MQTATVQMCSSPDVAANLASAHALLTQAAAQGAELAVLPEYFCGMGRHEHDKLAWAEDFGSGPIQEALARWAQELGLWIVAGTLPLRSPVPQRVFNTSLVFNPQGQCCARYDKIHLFRFGNEREQYDEAAAITPGTRPVVAEVTDRSGHRWRVGLSVCYDLRFPELYRHHAQAGADIVVVPSAFTRTTGQAHWEVLLRARAIENQCFVLAAAQGGQHDNGRRTWGHSMAINAWGEVVGQRTQAGAGVVLATLEPAHLQRVRQQLPALEHRTLS